MSNIQAAIEQAKAAAGSMVSEIVQPSANVPSLATPAGQPITLMDNLTGTFAVDAWLKVKPYGFTIGNDQTLFEKLNVEIDLGAVQYCRSVRFGNPAQYAKTYDGVRDVRGGLWAETVARAKQMGSQGDYRSCDIALTLVETLKKRDGSVLLEAGKKVGYAPSITGWNDWADFAKRVMETGLPADRGVVRATVEAKFNKNPSGEWGTLRVLDFEAKA